MKFLVSAPIYLTLYILFMLPTYVLPYLGSNSAAMISLQNAAPTGTNLLTWVHVGAMVVLIALAWFRGSLVDKKWLVAFPVLAIVFDFVPVLSLIPFVPTVMHLLAMILGVVNAKAVPMVTTSH